MFARARSLSPTPSCALLASKIFDCIFDGGLHGTELLHQLGDAGLVRFFYLPDEWVELSTERVQGFVLVEPHSPLERPCYRLDLCICRRRCITQSIHVRVDQPTSIGRHQLHFLHQLAPSPSNAPMIVPPTEAGLLAQSNKATPDPTVDRRRCPAPARISCHMVRR
jgi:hypothetical protein